MIVLGIHDGHNCGSALFKDGNLICALSEERVTRNKNEYGFPIHAINFAIFCLLEYFVNEFILSITSPFDLVKKLDLKS